MYCTIPETTTTNLNEFNSSHEQVDGLIENNLRIHEDLIFVHCFYCEATFPSMRELNMHTMSNHGESIHPSSPTIQAHISSKNQSNEFTCYECGRSFHWYQALMLHLQAHTPPRDETSSHNASSYTPEQAFSPMDQFDGNITINECKHQFPLYSNPTIFL